MSANLSFSVVVVGLTRFLPCKSMSAEKFGTKELYYTPAPTLVVSCGERDRTHTHTLHRINAEDSGLVKSFSLV